MSHMYSDRQIVPFHAFASLIENIPNDDSSDCKAFVQAFDRLEDSVCKHLLSMDISNDSTASSSSIIKNGRFIPVDLEQKNDNIYREYKKQCIEKVKKKISSIRSKGQNSTISYQLIDEWIDSSKFIIKQKMRMDGFAYLVHVFDKCLQAFKTHLTSLDHVHYYLIHFFGDRNILMDQGLTTTYGKMYDRIESLPSYRQIILKQQMANLANQYNATKANLGRNIVRYITNYGKAIDLTDRSLAYYYTEYASNREQTLARASRVSSISNAPSAPNVNVQNIPSVLIASNVSNMSSMTSTSSASSASSASNVPNVTSNPSIDIRAFTIKKIASNNFDTIQAKFSSVQSLAVKETALKNRSDLKKFEISPIDGDMKEMFNTDPPILSASYFLPSQLIEHLMRNKKDTALGVKYERGDAITNAEGAAHTYITPLCVIQVMRDYAYLGRHTAVPISVGTSKVSYRRTVILSAAIQPDFENGEVLLPLMNVTKNELKGDNSLSESTEIPSPDEKNDAVKRSQYDTMIYKHLVYHLCPVRHTRPSLDNVTILEYEAAKQNLEKCISESSEKEKTVNVLLKYLHEHGVKFKEYVLSLEMLFMSYVHQLRNEMFVLDQLCANGWIYTLDPPRIFAEEIDVDKGPIILNRLQLLAFAYLLRIQKLQHLKCVAISNFADPELNKLWQTVLKNNNMNVHVIAKANLMNGDGYQRIPEIANDTYALVIHNNSDAFGQNIEFEGSSSLDGVIGSYSNAYRVLNRKRQDLNVHVWNN